MCRIFCLLGPNNEDVGVEFVNFMLLSAGFSQVLGEYIYIYNAALVIEHQLIVCLAMPEGGMSIPAESNLC